jgi:hypothetical protein
LAVPQLTDIRNRFLPMLSYLQQEYGYRVPAGYPVIHDDIQRGVVGMELDPNHSVYITSDGQHLHADLVYRSQRTDNRSSGGWEKFGGQDVNDRRDVPDDVTDQYLRNLLAELMSRWNSQQTLLYITDS